MNMVSRPEPYITHVRTQGDITLRLLLYVARLVLRSFFPSLLVQKENLAGMRKINVDIVGVGDDEGERLSSVTSRQTDIHTDRQTDRQIEQIRLEIYREQTSVCQK